MKSLRVLLIGDYQYNIAKHIFLCDHFPVLIYGNTYSKSDIRLRIQIHDSQREGG